MSPTDPEGDAGNGGGASSSSTDGQPTNENLIKNGDFSQGGEYWDLEYQAGTASKTSTGGEFCVQNESATVYTSFSLGYPPTITDAFALEPGVPYTLSYRIRGEAKTFDAKIGGAAPPYTPVASFDEVVNSPSLYVTKSHPVASTSGVQKTGLVFNVVLDYSGSVCFDDVVLVKN